jgi:hypothetical protein
MRVLIIAILFFGNNLFGQQNFQTAKPWTYWWWMGSAVDQENIQRQLSDFAEAGLGGVHIIPIYGARGYEDRFLNFLSEDWLAIVDFTIHEAEKLNMGVDLTLGTGWPYGGNWMTPEYAAKKLVRREFSIENSKKINLDISQLKSRFELLDIIAAYASSKYETVDLTPYLKNGILTHKLAKSDWKITLFGLQQTMQEVKRAAPGGEGMVMDYFDGKSVQHYLNHFDSVFTQTKYPIHPRAFYHDSYEVYGANWTGQFTHAFKQQQGYDLLDYIHMLTDTMHPDYPLIIHDIRATLAELLFNEFTRTWTDWSTRHSSITRNQAHGSPANLLDLYGLSTIPETESFGCSDFDIPNLSCDPDYEESRFGRPHPLMMKFASSPANLLGKPLISSETGTWLANHFKVSLRRVKPQIDELFTAGINHIFYHGITYSPGEEGFPGWLFYASTNFGTSSHFWDELPLLNHYIEGCQSLLQEAQADNEILLYFPINDLWTKYKGDILLLLDVHHYDQWFTSTTFGKTADLLWSNGYSFDYISDKQISQLKTDGQFKASVSGTSKYKTLVVPAVDYIPESTMAEFEKLAGQGLKIVFVNHLPKHYSGLLAKKSKNTPARLSQGFIVSDVLLDDLKKLDITGEELSAKGLDFIRKSNAQGKLYFITNLSNRFHGDSLSLSADYKYVSIMDPQTNKQEYIETGKRFFLEIPPGKSYFIQTLESKPDEEKWHSYLPFDTLRLNHEWKVRFDDWQANGLKEEYNMDTLISWTDWNDQALKSFCGKAKYSTSFTMNNPDTSIYRYILRIEDVRESAQVFVNGVPQGTIWAFPNQIELSPEILKTENQLEIVVQNLSSNYMRLYDKQNPGWKKFYDINFVDITYNTFNPSEWLLEPSGLIGEVYITKEK